MLGAAGVVLLPMLLLCVRAALPGHVTLAGAEEARAPPFHSAPAAWLPIPARLIVLTFDDRTKRNIATGAAIAMRNEVVKPAVDTAIPPHAAPDWPRKKVYRRLLQEVLRGAEAAVRPGTRNAIAASHLQPLNTRPIA